MPTSQSNNRIIAITMGDPGGIGPEVTLKALAHKDVKACARQAKKPVVFVIIGSPEIYQENKKLIKSSQQFHVIDCLDRKKLDARKINILDINDDPYEVEFGKISLANAALSYHALEIGAYCAREKIVDALVTASINKEAVQLISPQFTGHTEYLARISKTKKFAMMLQGGPLRVVLVTTHKPLSEVGKAITATKIVEKIELTYAFLKQYEHIRKPRIGVAGFNPHCGEGGRIGTEEIKTIIPAIKRARKKGYQVEGPLPADIIFHEAYNGKLDAIIAMYHDQGLGPLKMIAFHTGVNITLNLPFIRTSPDHGTAFDIAYQNKAHPGSMIEAIKTAIKYS